MRRNRIFLFLTALTISLSAFATDVVPNLTPYPKSMVVGDGSLTLTQGFRISAAGLPDSLKAEVQKFMDDINATTGLGAEITDQPDGLFRLSIDESKGTEAYYLRVYTDSVKLRARTAAGFFYGLQSIKKMLPANVMAGRRVEGISYTLPVVNISDEPRFGYRGFMLDVSRHFFTVDEVKRMVDLMADYKMNTFHWHLSDDQGWRVEIKKYPKLTTIGATRANSWNVDMDYGDYWSNAQYGPYFYTQEEIRDVVDYCHARHIRVIPEVDMPGHFAAAMTAYPEYSCYPNGSHSVWVNGGISSDVMNVANAKAVAFAEDILDELMSLFPDGYVHIGGDECPTSAWQNNSECQAQYTALGLTSYRQLQSHFIKTLADHVSSKGCKLIVWNESITADGADLDLIQSTGATVMCWNPCQSGALKAAQMGLPAIITEYHSGDGGYYINRKQSGDAGEPTGAGYGNDGVEGCYNYVPVPTSVDASLIPYYIGVQGTFWTEHVANNKYLEYLALPRLMAVAEAGWTPQSKKDFASFKQRMAQDTAMLNMNNYMYGRHIWKNDAQTAMPTVSTDENPVWYRLVTMNTGDANRKDKCIELLRAASPIIGTGNAQAGRLWGASQAEEGTAAYDYQWWAIYEDPSNAGHYALVCKAQPKGSVNSTPTASNTSGRWDYDNSTRHYGFTLDYKGDGGSNHYYTILADGQTNYMNMAANGQNYSINLYSNPADGNSGYWLFTPMVDESETSGNGFSQALYDALPKLQNKDTIRISCSVSGYENIYMADTKSANYLTWATADADNIDWVVFNVTTMDSTYTQTVRLRNVSSKRFINTPASNSVDNIGFPVDCLSAISSSYAPAITIQYQPATGDYQILSEEKNLFPILSTSPSNPGIISAGSSVNSTGLAPRPQGAGWKWTIMSNETAIKSIITGKKKHGHGRAFDLQGRLCSQSSSRAICIVDGKKILSD